MLDLGGATRRSGSGEVCASRLHEIVTAYKFATLQNGPGSTRLGFTVLGEQSAHNRCVVSALDPGLTSNLFVRSRILVVISESSIERGTLRRTPENFFGSVQYSQPCVVQYQGWTHRRSEVSYFSSFITSFRAFVILADLFPASKPFDWIRLYRDPTRDPFLSRLFREGLHVHDVSLYYLRRQPAPSVTPEGQSLRRIHFNPPILSRASRDVIGTEQSASYDSNGRENDSKRIPPTACSPRTSRSPLLYRISVLRSHNRII